ncbi:META and DUF4377 domain-containing protein [Fulvimonas soli]|jgi:heat shock protein HslJ|uniref:Heat shock protein HslJ n=1 Tax=Fulvimonas soli TaxID=155197 RepID=A0A316HYL5_9GAMM|nr:META and DUF4377 domain-containing protein [Fulvimonas soli]PWK85840.1 heat shock protein HslJ [Fulvimonas soli]TNY27254.1 hypothetical protein BV497_04545 [Fulvimonas soli]
MKAASLLLPLLLAACASAPSARADDPSAAAVDAQLPRYHWRLDQATGQDGKRIEALFARPDKPLQLDFANGHVHVSNACNAIGGSYRLENGHLHVDALMHTMMACMNASLNALDHEISRTLAGTPAVRLENAAGTPHLFLVTAGGDTLDFAGVPTPETRYGGPGQTLFLEIAADTQPCPHPLVPGKQCLMARERHYDAQGLATGAPGPWQPLYQDIEGYTHEPGVRNVLRVKRYAVAHPAADAPAVAYVLDMVVESEQVRR